MDSKGREVKLPSGRMLVIGNSPFATSKALYQAVLEEFGNLEISMDAGVPDMIKNVFCLGFSSKKIEKCLDDCMKRVTIDSIRIDDQTFEKVEHREDYLDVCYEVALENLLPFTKSLYAKYQVILKRLESIQA